MVIHSWLLMDIVSNNHGQQPKIQPLHWPTVNAAYQQWPPIIHHGPTHGCQPAELPNSAEQLTVGQVAACSLAPVVRSQHRSRFTPPALLEVRCSFKTPLARPWLSAHTVGWVATDQTEPASCLKHAQPWQNAAAHSGHMPIGAAAFCQMKQAPLMQNIRDRCFARKGHTSLGTTPLNVAIISMKPNVWIHRDYRSQILRQLWSFWRCFLVTENPILPRFLAVRAKRNRSAVNDSQQCLRMGNG